MHKEMFKKYIAYYGPDISLWPESLVDQGYKCLKNNPSLQEDLDIEQELSLLLASQVVEPHSTDLASRIISQAKPHRKTTYFNVWGQWFFNTFPSPVYAYMLLMALLVGFGFGYSDLSDQAFMYEADGFTINEFLYYDGELL